MQNSDSRELKTNTEILGFYAIKCKRDNLYPGDLLIAFPRQFVNIIYPGSWDVCCKQGELGGGRNRLWHKNEKEPLCLHGTLPSQHMQVF